MPALGISDQRIISGTALIARLPSDHSDVVVGEVARIVPAQQAAVSQRVRARRR